MMLGPVGCGLHDYGVLRVKSPQEYKSGEKDQNRSHVNSNCPKTSFITRQTFPSEHLQEGGEALTTIPTYKISQLS